ncbi:methylenetetrahydrofolate reductase-domain-containing protein [Sporodiniella umbellata]|nr:methylenetetrahydrofolate reductase-domain-containing protein [Sporodiniella umbellata]
MKIIDKIKEGDHQKKINYSFEFFPPKTELGYTNLMDRLGRMSQLRPEFISCTWGAGGSTHERTLKLCSEAQSLGLCTLMHLTCTNLEEDRLRQALEEASAAGIHNILALRGDPPRGREYGTQQQAFQHAIDLVRFIRKHYGDQFCIGVAGYPEGHVDSQKDPGQELDFLKAKVDAGADFIVTQFFYDPDRFLLWMDTCRAKGIQVPIVPGIMPIPTYQTFRRMLHLCHVQVPPSVLATLETIKGDDQKVKDYGVSLAVEMIQKLHQKANLCHFHISTLNLERSTRLILDQLNPYTNPQPPSTLSPFTPARDPGKIAVWDEFPNGRYGDYRSPAFGENTYGAGQLLPTSQAIDKWGTPKKTEDVTHLFKRYVCGELDSLPWCEESLSTETEEIRQELLRWIDLGYWTVSSQPAVNGRPSEDPVYGWGPKEGYVYQKAFVEFFVSDQIFKALTERLSKIKSITWFSTNRKGDFLSNVSHPDAQCTVTWGVFPEKEIIQPTIIEKASFESWKVRAK